MNANVAINAYNKIGLESGIIAADPHTLILMLFEGALLAISNAKTKMQQNDFATRGKSINHAIRIIGEGLNASLDKKVGGKLAQDLSSLYDYMVMRLVDANAKSDVTALDEVTRLLSELKESWKSIKPGSPAISPKTVTNAPLVYAKG